MSVTYIFRALGFLWRATKNKRKILNEEIKTKRRALEMQFLLQGYELVAGFPPRLLAVIYRIYGMQSGTGVGVLLVLRLPVQIRI